MYATIDASSDNIPTTYGTGAGSLILDGSPSAGHLAIINTTGSDIAYTVTTHPSVTPSDSTTDNKHQYLVPAAPTGGASASTQDYLIIGKGDRVFIKVASGSAASSGKVHVVVW